jgi:hypothetical protein
MPIKNPWRGLMVPGCVARMREVCGEAADRWRDA